MEEFKEVIDGVYHFMLDIKVPVFGQMFSLWVIFLFGLIGALVTWFMVKYFN